MSRLIFPFYTFPPLDYMQLLLKQETASLSISEPFLKQTYRSRFEIMTAQQRTVLSLQMAKGKTKTTLQTATLSYAENWQKKHWQTIDNAYKNSPFFEYYDYKIQPVFMQKPDLLWQYNFDLLQCILTCLKSKTKLIITEELPNTEALIAQETVAPYDQVFMEQHGFMPNLSILDWLFNIGGDF